MVLLNHGEGPFGGPPNDMYAVFSEITSHNVGDPYTKDGTTLSRHRGKQFSAPYQPKGSGPDAMIDKTTKLTVTGDHYVDPYSLQKDLSKRSSIHSKAWSPSGGTKKPGGSGTLYGIFGPSNTLLDTDASLGARSGRQQPSSVAGKRNIYVNPAKKGTFGFPWQDRSIGQTRFDFIPDEYYRGRILEKDMKKEARAKIPKPFISTGRTGRGIVPIVNTSAGGPPAGAVTRTSSAPDPSRKPWRACSPPQKGPGYGTISKIEYIPQCTRGSSAPARDANAKAFKPASAGHKRLSMWAPNPYQYAARPAPDNDLSLLG